MGSAKPSANCARIGQQNFGHSADFCGFLGGIGGVVTDHQNVHFATGFRRRSDRIQRCRTDRLPVMLRKHQRRHQITFASVFSFATKVSRIGHLDPRLATRRLSHLQRLQPRRHVHAQILGLQILERLFLRLHDVRQRDVARLVQPKIGRDDRRQRNRNRFQPAVDFARDLRAAVGDHDLRCKRRLRHVGQRSKHLARLIGIVVDRLLARDHELRLAPCRRSPSTASRPRAAAIPRWSPPECARSAPIAIAVRNVSWHCKYAA